MGSQSPKTQMVLSNLSISSTGKKRISQKVNYDYLDELCNISGLQNRNDQHINEVAHQKFIELYPKVFYQEKSALPRIPEAHLKRIPKLSDQPVDEKYHDIGSYLKKIRGVLKVEQESLQKREHIDMLIRILKKLPILRTAREHKIVCRMMKLIPDINVQLSDAELKELSMNTIKEYWEKGSTVVGNQGFYAILKGSARPQKRLYKRMLGENFDTWAAEASPQPAQGSASDLFIQELLVTGSCFGTLEALPPELQKIRLSVITEEDCEILKISCLDYLRVRKEVAKRERVAKEELIRKCSYYRDWPRQYILQLAPHLQWRQFPAGHELVKVGEISAFVGFISSGFCNICRDVKAFVELPLGKRVRRIKKVPVGQLHRNESFGEVSILLQVPFTCTIITATAVKMGTIDADDMLNLDRVTQMLLLQKAKPTFDNITQGSGMSHQDLDTLDLFIEGAPSSSMH